VNGDGYIDLSDATYLLWYLFGDYAEPMPIDPRGGPLPATGQALCYDNDGNEIACDTVEFPGQDGFYLSGCSMEDRFVDNGDGTVTDTCTGLMWQQLTASIGKVRWQEALEYCDDLALAGQSDWRLPDVRELQSLADYGRYDPAIDPVFSAELSWYWSATTRADDPNSAWLVSSVSGYVLHDSKGSHVDYVRAVRGGL
jgi:hypothetical protein